MRIQLSASFLLASAGKAKVLPRAGPVSTATIVRPLPSQAAPFATTIPACGDANPFVILGVPTSTAVFYPGTITIYVPPQASPTTTTIYDTQKKASEVIVIKPLPGTCADWPLDPLTPTGTNGLPTPTPEACPEKGCAEDIVKSGQLVINVINEITLLSQNLQGPAIQIGAAAGAKRDGSLTKRGPIEDVARELRKIATTLSTAAPSILFLDALPSGCSTDTVVIAFMEFVRVHQVLLNILIGRASIIGNAPIKRDAALVLDEGSDNALIGALVAGALRQVEAIVDTVAFKLIQLVPERSECAQNQKDALDDSLGDAISVWEGI